MVWPITGRRSAKLSFCGAAIICLVLTRPATIQTINRRQRGSICFLSHSSCDHFAITMPVPLTRIGCVNGGGKHRSVFVPRVKFTQCALNSRNPELFAVPFCCFLPVSFPVLFRALVPELAMG